MNLVRLIALPHATFRLHELHLSFNRVVWLCKQERLRIYQLQGNIYNLQTQSRYFLDTDLQSTIDRALQIAYDRNTSSAIRNLRQRLRDSSTP